MAKSKILRFPGVRRLPKLCTTGAEWLVTLDCVQTGLVIYVSGPYCYSQQEAIDAWNQRIDRLEAVARLMVRP